MTLLKDGDIKQWQKLFFSRFYFHCNSKEPIELPSFAGTTLRGAFGTALLARNCMYNSPICKSCDIRDNCPYFYLFEGIDYDSDSGVRAYPHPFVIEPTSLSGRIDGNFGFGILLFGKAIELLPNIIDAISAMGQIGIGKGRGRFELLKIEQVLDDDQSEENILFRDGNILKEPIYQRLSNSRVQNDLQIFFKTPLRLKKKGKYIYVPRFDDLVRAVLRRTTLLVEGYCDDKFELDFDKYVEKAEKIRITRDGTRWIEFRRHSSRQNRKVPMHGTYGKITYSGDFSGMEYLIEALKNIHIGSATAFGFGRITLLTDRK